MASIGPSFLILGVVMVTVIAAQTSSSPDITVTTTESNDQNSSMTNTVSVSTLISEKTSYTTIAINNTADVTSEPGNRTTSINFTSTIATLTTKGNEGPESSKSTQSPMTTSTPLSASQSTLTTKGKNTKQEKKTATIDRTGIIILVVIIIVALGFGVACYFARKRGRRYSVDFNSRPDEANIPLSTIPSEMPPDNAPQNGLQTFQSIETNAKESQEPEAKPLVQEEQKAEADKSVVDPSAESADSSGDKPKEDVAEQSPPAPVGPNPEEKTDDEGIVSNKTSVESLKETNENNSNNADVTQKKDWKFTNVFWEVSLDNPV